LSDYSSNRRNQFNVFVINLVTRSDRKSEIYGRLEKIGLLPKFITAIEPKDLVAHQETYLSETAECVWRSHNACLRLASESDVPTLILEDDAILRFSKKDITNLLKQMNKNRIDFLQIGFLNLHLADTLSIYSRNIYNFILKRQLAPKVFERFGFKEVMRAQNQKWRQDLPSNFVINDIRYGAHCYIVTPNFAKKMLDLNSPAFLSADDFYVALGKMKSFKMIRLSKSLSSQDDSISSFKKRFVLK